LEAQLEYWAAKLFRYKDVLAQYRKKKYDCSLVCHIDNNMLVRFITFKIPDKLQKKLSNCNVDTKFIIRTDDSIIEEAIDEGLEVIRNGKESRKFGCPRPSAKV
jgi:hypothetical protein